MGDYTLDDINELLDNIEDILGLLNKVYWL
jgi:hypothetical protein